MYVKYAMAKAFAVTVGYATTVSSVEAMDCVSMAERVADAGIVRYRTTVNMGGSDTVVESAVAKAYANMVN